MRELTATKIHHHFGDLLSAIIREPVTITRAGRRIAVVLSASEYDRLRPVLIAEFHRFCDSVALIAASRGLTPTILADILARET
jgi:prevent-host-death family protein